MTDNKKLRVGLFAMTSCYGCQLQILNLEERILSFLEYMDIVYWRLVQETPADPTNLDLAIIEGSVSNDDELKEVKEIRENADMVIAIGACAHGGGVQGMKNLMNRQEVTKAAYEDLSGVRESEVKAIDEVIDVDAQIRGCPINKDEFENAVYSLVLGRQPDVWNMPVCNECKIRHNNCFFERDEPTVCLGPITEAGCGARCPSNGTPCDGCRGWTNDPHISQQIKEMRKRGLNTKDIVMKIRRYTAGLSAQDSQVYPEMKEQ